jgi:hypothetical protein
LPLLILKKKNAIAKRTEIRIDTVSSLCKQNIFSVSLFYDFNTNL